MTALPNSCSELVCNPQALTPVEFTSHSESTKALFASRQQLVELLDGFALGYPFSPEQCQAITEFMVLEHCCCPFLRFGLEIEPNNGLVWLRLGGSAEIKEFLKSEMNLL